MGSLDIGQSMVDVLVPLSTSLKMAWVDNTPESRVWRQFPSNLHRVMPPPVLVVVASVCGHGYVPMIGTTAAGHNWF